MDVFLCLLLVYLLYRIALEDALTSRVPLIWHGLLGTVALALCFLSPVAIKQLSLFPLHLIVGYIIYRLNGWGGADSKQLLCNGIIFGTLRTYFTLAAALIGVILFITGKAGIFLCRNIYLAKIKHTVKPTYSLSLSNKIPLLPFWLISLGLSFTIYPGA